MDAPKKTSLRTSIITNGGTHHGGHHHGPLNQADILRLQAQNGVNTVQTGKKRKCYQVFFGALIHPFNVLLTVLAVSSGLALEFETLGIMMVMVFLSTVLRFHQEWKSEVAVKSLLKYVAAKVTVLRRNEEGQVVEDRIASTDVVPGDWIKLYPGELVPADVEVLDSKDLYVSQAALTGEGIPAEKHRQGPGGDQSSKASSIIIANIPVSEKGWLFHSRLIKFFRQIFGLPVYTNVNDHPEAGPDETDLDRVDLCFMGSAVVSGTATCRVITIGTRTHFGRLASELAKRRPQNAFQLGVRRISWIFFITMICMIPPVLLLQALLVNDDGGGGDDGDSRCTNRWCKAAFFALSVAVGLTPEMLPMIVSTALAKGAVDMSKKNCIVKQLDAIINMGGIDVLCTDKTGTLTMSVVTLNLYVNRYGTSSSLPLLLGYLNSHFQSVRQNPLDSAITAFFGKNDINGAAEVIEKIDFVDEIPFDFVRRRMSVILRDTSDEHQDSRFLICKGAVDEVLQKCVYIVKATSSSNDLAEEDMTNVYDVICDGLEHEIMTDEILTDLQNLNETLSEDGLRMIAVAFKKLPAPNEIQEIGYSVDDESELTFVGLLAFLDPPKESSREAIEYLRKHNVAVKVLTGDSHLVCKKICVDIGVPADKIITGKQMTKMASQDNPQETLRAIAEEYTIFAKLTPVQKSEIVRALKMNNHIVGFLGDGINDAPALTEADVGISVDSGADICKESANIILLEKDITVVVDAVVTGRKTYGNTLKYIVMTVSSNFGNVFSILVASAWLPFEPMASLHLLVQNLLYDISQIAIPWDHMDPEFLLVPHRWSMKSVLKFMVMIGPWSSVFDISTYAFMYFYFDIKTNTDKEKVKLFQSSWFCVGLLTQTLIVHMIRTPKIPFIQSWASLPVVVMTVLIMGIGIAIPFIPGLRDCLQMTQLEWQVYPFVAAVLVGYCVAAQLAKMMYVKIFKEWY